MVLLPISPNAVHRLSRECFSVDQATGIRFVIWIVLNNLALKNADEDFVKREMIGLSFLVSMVGNPYSIVAYGVNDVFQIHLVLPFERVLLVTR